MTSYAQFLEINPAELPPQAPAGKVILFVDETDGFYKSLDDTGTVIVISGVAGVNSVTGDGVDNTDPENPVLSFPNADEVDDSATSNKFVTAGDLSLIASALQAGDNISLLTNDAGYITLAEVPAADVTSVFGRAGVVVAEAGDYDTSQVPENTNLYYTDARVQAVPEVANAEQVTEKGLANGYPPLDATGKIPASFLPTSTIEYKGSFGSASSTTGGDLPASANTGDLYICDEDNFVSAVAGETFNTGDKALFDGVDWNKIDNNESVSSVFGRLGNVVAQSGDYNTDQVTEGTNKYYSETLFDASLSSKTSDDVAEGVTNLYFTDAERTKLAGIEDGAQVNVVDSVNGQTGAVSLDKSDIGLSNVDNTSDLDKPISTATQTALDDKIETVAVDGVTITGNGVDIPLTATTSSSGVQSVTGDGVDNADPSNPVISYPDKSDIGLGNVDNTSDIDKPISNATQAALDLKGDMFKSVYDTDDDGIVDKSESVVFKAELNQNVVKGNLLYGVGRNPVTGTPVAGLADNTVSFADKTVGMALENGNSGQIIEVVKIGVIEDIDTSLYAVGETVYLSTSGTFDSKANITTGIFNPVGYVVKSAVVDGSLIIDTTATESITTGNTINESTVAGRTVTEALDNLAASSGGVQSVTGDGVDNADPENPVLSFPDADQVDDSATTNKFATAAELGQIGINQANISANESAIIGLQSNVTQNTTDITDLQNNKVDSVTGARVDNTDPLNPIINLPLYKSAQAGITRVGQTTVALANQQANVFEEYFNDSFTPSVTDNFQVSVAYQWSSNVTQNSASFRLTLSDGVNPDLVQTIVVEPKDASGTGVVVDVLEGGAIVGQVNTGTAERIQEYFPLDIILTAGLTYNIKIEWTTDVGANSRLTIYSSTIRWEQKTQNF